LQEYQIVFQRGYRTLNSSSSVIGSSYATNGMRSIYFFFWEIKQHLWSTTHYSWIRRVLVSDLCFIEQHVFIFY